MKPYVGGWGQTSSEVMFVGEAISYQEEQAGRPFAGESGKLLFSMAAECRFNSTEVYTTNVIRNRPPTDRTGGLDLSDWISFTKAGAKGRDMVWLQGAYVSAQMLEHMAHLRREIEIVKPKLIVACGNIALWALTGKRKITDWRGSQMQLNLHDCAHKCKVVPTYNPAYVYRFPAERRIVKRDLKRAFDWLQKPDDAQPEWNFTIRPSFEQTMEFLDGILTKLEVASVLLSVDIETRQRQVACVGIALSKYEAFCIPILAVGQPSGYWTEEQEVVVVGKLRTILAHRNARIIGHNFHYDDYYFASRWGFACNVHADTMILWHVLFNNLEKRLSFLCSILCDHYVYWKDDGKEWDKSVPEEQYWIYNCTDCVRTFEAYEVVTAALAKANLTKQAQFEMDLYPMVRAMMLRGMAQDVALKQKYSTELAAEIVERKGYLEYLFGHPVNPKSTPQMKALFYEDFKIKTFFNRKTGKATTDDAALEKIAKVEPLLRPVIRAMAQTRSLTVFKSTFADADLDTDQRIRTHFWIPGTSTFRFSSKTNPLGTGANLQNLPKGAEIFELLKASGGRLAFDEVVGQLKMKPDKLLEALSNGEKTGFVDQGFVAHSPDGMLSLLFYLPNIRKLFIPDPGHVLVASDLERADLQVVVWEADDADLKALLHSGLDFHTELKIPGLTRQQKKQLIHATNYGAKPPKIAEALGISVHAAGKAQHTWLSMAPGIKHFQDRVIDSLRTRGYVENAFGFRMHFFGRPDDSIPEALAAIPQSTVAIAINKGLLNVYRNLPQAQTLLQVHDEGVFQTAEANFPSIMPELDRQMRVTIPYSDPLVIPLEHKISRKSWGELEKFKIAA